MRVLTAPDPASAAELEDFSEFLLQIGEGRYPVNEEIDENDICLPQDVCVLPESTLALDDETKEDEEGEDMESPPNFNLLPPMDEQHPRDLDETEDDRRTRHINALIDAVYSSVDGRTYRMFTSLKELFWLLPMQP
ncbi:hypothetical protein PC116_g23938 [Phytophthora cactorum]|uniref:Uncharacterized protein n=1 Tax=Phytophthora cactorum TaxID=29920 RepID=A0A329RKX3_9STRA|nr:hypothetical protein PC114_g21736 [Phytophthora cactorum]KAG2979758.1 hypothetical protein PC119_g21399 [Phytophthora cactorum]KAG2999584.1 hypothetical protein PC120_g20873 [Phytophthora cactorum]KAG3133808.1 hypothetical protein C6341_g22389 [Phytophthora cactorum]KAG4227686.1 hypothetical protein PC116_g23938 [Phytophthora cactorum]